jgi:phosphoribosylaminoimidazole-succinocarboxamide synthase
VSLNKIASGKVREIYELDDKHLLLVSSDRISAFDVIMNEPIPDRGRVLTALTEFWLAEIFADVPNHYVSTEVPAVATDVPDVKGRCMVVRKAEMLPIEVIVRGYLAGSGWAEYQKSGTLHGQRLSDGLTLGSKLPEPVLTPSTKGELGQHDVNLTWDEAAAIVGNDVLKQAEAMALDIYKRAVEHAANSGFIVADTKFELGYIDGTLSLCDEVLTPDSSRFWPQTGWQLGETPPSYDKQQLRDWLETQPWDKTSPPPALPTELVDAVRARYVEIYQRLSGRNFVSPA